MSADTYANLKSEISNHADFSFSDSDLDTFIDLAEARINREIRVEAMVSSFSDTIASGVVAVPSDFREWLSVWISGSPNQALEPRPADWLFRTYPDRSSDSKPLFIARVGSNFEFGPYPDSAYTVAGHYYATPTALSSANTTNWMTSNAPDLLLYACLEVANRFNRDDAAANFWLGLYEEAKRQVMRENIRSRLPGQSKRETRVG